MYKTLVRNALGRATRAAGRAKAWRFRARQPKAVLIAQARKERQNKLRTEPHLLAKLGRGSEFVERIFAQYEREFSAMEFDVKHCSAYLNTVAKLPTLDGSLWSDDATESMFRRARKKKRKK